MRYTLRQLEVFIAVANHENLTKAAEELSMSQSAASSALKDLEDRYELQLFDRIGKRLQLNEQGQLIRKKAEALLDQAKDLENSLFRHAELGPISVGATLSIGNYLAVNMVAKYKEINPEAKVRLDVANTRTVIERVLNYELDIGLIEGEINHPDLDISPWREDELVVFCSPSHPLVKIQEQRGYITDEDVLAAKWIMREPGSGTRQGFERVMFRLFPRLKVVLELQHTEAIKRAVEANLGIACLSLITLKDAFNRGSLVHLRFPSRDFSRQLYLIVRKEKYRSAGIQAWIDFCKA
ncbi:MAG: LysR family transcriptional regulator [Venatoribacter sp.]